MNRDFAAEQARDHALEYVRLVVPMLARAPIAEEDRRDLELALGLDLSNPGIVSVTTVGLDLPAPESDIRAAVAELSAIRLADLGIDVGAITQGQGEAIERLLAKTKRLRQARSVTPGMLLRRLWRGHLAAALEVLGGLPVSDETFRWLRREVLHLAGVRRLIDGFYVSEEVGRSGKVGAISVEDSSEKLAAAEVEDLLCRRETIAAWAWESIVDDEDGGSDVEAEPVPGFRRAIDAKKKAKAEAAKEAQSRRDREEAEVAEAERKASRQRVEALRAQKRAAQPAKNTRTREKILAELAARVEELEQPGADGHDGLG